MEGGDICAAVRWERYKKLTTFGRVNKGRPMNTEYINTYKSDTIQSIPKLLKEGRTNERKDDP